MRVWNNNNMKAMTARMHAVHGKSCQWSQWRPQTTSSIFLYLMFNVIDEQDDVIRQKMAKILDILEHYDEEHYEAMISGVVAIGSNYWMELYPGELPLELAPFPDMSFEDRNAPVVPSDLYIQIRADRADICHAIGVEVYDLLKVHVELVEKNTRLEHC